MLPPCPIEHVPLLGTGKHLPQVNDEFIFRDHTDVCPEWNLLLMSWARLEESLEDDQVKIGQDETELICPEDKLMTKSQGEPF